MKDVDPGQLPRTLDELRNGRRDPLVSDGRQRQSAARLDQPTSAPQMSLEETLDQLMEEADGEEVSTAADVPVPNTEVERVPVPGAQDADTTHSPAQPDTGQIRLDEAYTQAQASVGTAQRERDRCEQALNSADADLRDARERLRRIRRRQITAGNFARVFGTRDDVQSEDYVSPITRMFTRVSQWGREAAERERILEEQRVALENFQTTHHQTQNSTDTNIPPQHRPREAQGTAPEIFAAATHQQAQNSTDTPAFPPFRAVARQTSQMDDLADQIHRLQHEIEGRRSRLLDLRQHTSTPPFRDTEHIRRDRLGAHFHGTAVADSERIIDRLARAEPNRPRRHISEGLRTQGTEILQQNGAQEYAQNLNAPATTIPSDSILTLSRSVERSQSSSDQINDFRAQLRRLRQRPHPAPVPPRWATEWDESSSHLASLSGLAAGSGESDNLHGVPASYALQLLRETRDSIYRTSGIIEQRSSIKGLDGDDRPEPKKDEEMQFKLDCRICYTQVADTACLPCGHLSMCQWCADQAIPVKDEDKTRPRDKLAKCPCCRGRVKSRVKIYPV